MAKEREMSALLIARFEGDIVATPYPVLLDRAF